MNKKTLAIIIISFGLFGLFLGEKTKAGSGDNVFGWAWSENIGWISFNCSNTDSCETVDYGVDIDSETGG